MRSRSGRRRPVRCCRGTGLGETLRARLLGEADRDAAPTPGEVAGGKPKQGLEHLESRARESSSLFVPEVVALAGDREALRRELDRRVLAGEIDAWVWLSQEGLDANEVEYHAESVSNFITQERLATSGLGQGNMPRQRREWAQGPSRE